MAGEKYQFGEIILVDFPFSDGVHSKLRPALVLSAQSDGDLLIARVTSTPRESSFDIFIKDWPSSHLMFPSLVRVNKLATILFSVVIKKTGSLPKRDEQQILAGLRKLIESLPANG